MNLRKFAILDRMPRSHVMPVLMYSCFDEVCPTNRVKGYATMPVVVIAA